MEQQRHSAYDQTRSKQKQVTSLLFKDTKNLNITNEGKRHLGAVVGTEEFRKEYAIMRVNEWVTELKLLSKMLNPIHKQHMTHSHQLLAKVNSLPPSVHFFLPSENIIFSISITQNLTSRSNLT